MTDALRLLCADLIVEWRREAAEEQRVSFCADELEAALSAVPVGQCPYGESCACAIMTRHEWHVAFCEERERRRKAGAAPVPVEDEQP
jgi:hypothetical protein